MINPRPNTLRRRAVELYEAGKREEPNDADACALFSFYAAECGLKAVYMRRNNLKDADDERAGCASARSFGHRLDALLQALQVPAAAIGQVPARVMKNSKQRLEIMRLHEAWRYGEKLDDTPSLSAWLNKLAEWARVNA